MATIAPPINKIFLNAMVSTVAQIPSVNELIRINKYTTKSTDGSLLGNLNLFKKINGSYV